MASQVEPSGVRLPASLETARIAALPNDAYYIADFISREEEAYILHKISTAAKPRWKHLTHRRLQTWPSDLVKDRLLDSPLPNWLADPIIPRLAQIPLSTSNPSSIFSTSPHKQPNHVLINEYPPGVGIMPHKVGRLRDP